MGSLNRIELRRRNLLIAACLGGAVMAASNRMAGAQAAPMMTPVAYPLAPSPVANLHLQFGADAATEMVVSWHSLAPVQMPRVLLGTMTGKLKKTVAATPVS